MARRRSVTITIDGTNDAAVISGDISGEATEAGGVANGTAGTTATGTLTDTDVDNAANTFQVVASPTAGDSGYGNYTVDASGHWSYAVADGNSVVQALNVGDTLSDTFTIQTADGTAQVVTITIDGANDAAVISGDISGDATEAGGLANGTPGTTATGALTDTDVDNAANTFQAAVDNGDSGYGSYTVDASGNWAYTVADDNSAVQALNVGDTLSDSFTVRTIDGTTQSVTVTIHGTNDAAVISGDISGEATEAGGVANGTAGTTATGTLTDTDVDNAANTFQVVASPTAGDSGYGNYTVDASGHWSYAVADGNSVVQALNVGDTLSDTFTIQTADGTAQVVTITIDGANDAPALDLDANDSAAAGSDYAATFTDTGSAVAIVDTDVNIIDLDTANMASATVTLTNAKSGDILAVNGPLLPGGIGATVNSATPGVITVSLSGSASKAAYAAALDQIVFSSQVNPDTTDRHITVVVNDGLSDSNAAISTIHVVDATPPSAVGTVTALSNDSGTAGDFITNVAPQTVSGTFTGTLDSGEKLQVSADGTTWIDATVDTGAGTFSASGVTLSLGTGTLLVRTIDASNNSTSGIGHSYTLDTGGLGAPVLALGTGVADGATAAEATAGTGVVTVTGEAGDSISVTFSNGAHTVIKTVTATGSSQAVTLAAEDLTTLTDGTISVSATQTDLADNTSPAGATSFVLDTAAPAAPSAPDLATASDSGSSSTDNITNVAAGTYTGTAEAGSTVKIFDTDGVTVVGSGTAVGGSYSIVTSALTSGSHTLTAKATDVAGNVGVASGSLAVTIDTTTTNPVISSIGAGGAIGGSDNTVSGQTGDATVVGTAEANSTVTVKFGATTLGTVAADGSGNWTYTLTAGNLTTIGQGSGKTVTATATDTAGNTSSATTSGSFTVDTTTTNPVISSIGAGGAIGGSDNTVSGQTGDATVVGTAEANSTVTVKFGATTLGTVAADGSGNWTYTLTAGNLTTIGQGSGKTVTATATDTAGNTSSATTSGSFTVDTAAPAAPSAPDLATASDSGSSSTDNITNVAAGTYTGTAEAGSTVKIFDTDGVTVVGSGTAVGGSYSIVTSALTSGSHTLTAKATDVAGNVGVASGSLAVTIDTTTTNPVISSIGAGGAIGGSDNTVSGQTGDATVVGTAEANSTVTVKFGATTLGTVAADGSGNWTYTLTAGNLTTIGQGSGKTVTATATDTAGNTSSATTSGSFTVDTAAPAAPSAPDLATASDSGSSSTDNITNVAAGTYTGTAEAGSTVKIFDTDGVTVVGSGTAVGGSYSIVTSALTSGSHTLTAKATDVAGNVGVASGSLAVTIDTTTTNPVISSIGAGGAIGGSDNTVSGQTGDATVVGTAEANSTVTVKFGATTLGTVAADGSGNWTYTLTAGNLTTIGQGSGKTVTATATDTAGNTSSATTSGSFTVDTTTTNPVISSIGAGGAIGGSDNTVSGQTGDATVVGTAEANSTVTVKFGATTLGTVAADGSGNWTYTLTAGNLTTIGQGSGKTVTATATDTAGNTSSATTSGSFTVDTAAPAAPSAPDLATASDSGSSSTDNITNVAAGTYTGTAEAGSTVKIFDTDGVTVVGSGTAVGGSYSIVTSALTSGSHTLTAKATDVAGNVGVASGSLAVTIDTTTTNPVISSIGAGGAIGGSDNTVSGQTGDATVVGTAEANSTVTVKFGATTLGTVAADGSGNWTYTLTAGNLTTIGQGSGKTVTATATDTAGNTSSATTSGSFTVDTAAPAAPSAPDLATASDSGSSSTDNITNVAAGTYTGTAEAGSTVKIFDTDGVTVVGSGTAVGGSYSIVTSALTSGSHTLTAKATDVAGNVGVASGSLAVTIDTTTTNPVISSIGAGGAIGGSDNTVSGQTGDATVVGTAEANSTVTVKFGATTLGTVAADGSGNWTYTLTAGNLTTIGQGSGKTVTATATDTAGNTSSATTSGSFTVDTTTTNPVISSIGAGGAIGGSDNTVSGQTGDATVVGTAEANSTVTVKFGATTLGTVAADGSGNWTYTLTAGNLTTIGQGSGKTVTATATDTAGNTSSATTSGSFTVDTAAPAAPSAPDLATASDSGSSSTDNITNVAAGTYTGTAEAGSTVKIFDTDGVTVVGSGTAVGGSYSIVTSALTSGSHTLTAKATDVAGNVGVASGSLAVTIDTTTTNPVISSIGAGGAIGGSDNTVSGQTGDATVVGTAEANSTVTVKFGATTLGTVAADGSGNWTYTLTAGNLTTIGQGSGKTVTATATDTAGNTSSATTSGSFTVDTAAPTVTVTSSATNLSNGQQATITFQFSEAVTGFDASAASDVTAVKGTLSNFVTVDAATYTATYTRGTGNNGSVTVNAGSYTDTAGNSGGGGGTGGVLPAGVSGSPINLGLADPTWDQGEVAVTVSGAPSDWVLSGGTHNADGSWAATDNQRWVACRDDAGQLCRRAYPEGR